MLKKQLTKLIECGTDEAGRGSLAGPVTAAAVIFPMEYYCTELDDSKKILCLAMRVHYIVLLGASEG